MIMRKKKCQTDKVTDNQTDIHNVKHGVKQSLFNVNITRRLLPLAAHKLFEEVQYLVDSYISA